MELNRHICVQHNPVDGNRVRVRIGPSDLHVLQITVAESKWMVPEPRNIHL